MPRTRFVIPDMSCGHCEARITSVLTALEGVESVRANAKFKEAEVDYDEARVSVETLRQVLAKDDFPVESTVML